MNYYLLFIYLLLYVGIVFRGNKKAVNSRRAGIKKNEIFENETKVDEKETRDHGERPKSLCKDNEYSRGYRRQLEWIEKRSFQKHHDEAHDWERARTHFFANLAPIPVREATQNLKGGLPQGSEAETTSTFLIDEQCL